VKSDAFRAAAEAKDFSAIDELFAEDVTFKSPVVYKAYEGREAVAMLLGEVLQVFQDFRYTDHTETGDTATLAFSARPTGIPRPLSRTVTEPSTLIKTSTRSQ
jgi:ketosteroid isomerase-like protein